MTQDEVIGLVSGLGCVHVMTADEASGAPEIAWGDTFFFYLPEGESPSDLKHPFASHTRAAGRHRQQR
jgi:hypothetical protein